MKNIILSAFIMLIATLSFAQIDGLTHVYITGPEICPDNGEIVGTRADGGYAYSDYWGQTNGGGGPSTYNIAWYNADFSVPYSTTVDVETWTGFAVLHDGGPEVAFKCRGSETKMIGWGVSQVFHISLGIVEEGLPGPPPPED